MSELINARGFGVLAISQTCQQNGRYLTKPRYKSFRCGAYQRVQSPDTPEPSKKKNLFRNVSDTGFQTVRDKALPKVKGAQR